MTIADESVRSVARPAWNELFEADGMPREVAIPLARHLQALSLPELQARQDAADVDILTMGITFRVYSDDRGVERAWPFDVIPRIIDAAEWQKVETGLVQRLQALNRFIDDIYNEQRALADDVIPADVLDECRNYQEACRGVRPAHGIWAHVSGSDLIRDADGTVFVLEDNLRVPSGVSYLLENRLVSKRAFADLFTNQSIQPVDDYPDELASLLASLAPDAQDPAVAVLTPGIYNSAYFEHSFLAQRMGVPLVEGRDLIVGDDSHIYARTITGPERVDVLYRRIDDSFLDPEVFDRDSMIGVRGLMRSWREGKVALANAPGTGVADDKLTYAWVPDLIRYYLGEEPILPNVPTLRCCYPDERKEVLANLRDLVVKPVDESGGFGLLIGDQATDEELRQVRAAITSEPRRWVAQPIMSLSTVPTLCDGEIAPRHVDLRPFVLTGQRSYVTRGGLTRVALAEGSLVVNSSQGGGSKDTWVVEECF